MDFSSSCLGAGVTFDGGIEGLISQNEAFEKKNYRQKNK
ncbi:hypothetical protein THER_0345 [Thermodesulfovibrio sp. N1]|nr:hypothetical protein THER_0345 [Thermodesulfovibrio sp. N1]